MTKRILTLMLCVAFLLALLPAYTMADDSGDYRDLHWVVNTTARRLELSRADDEGVMPDFESADDVPWRGYRNMIVAVALNSDFNNISTYAFYGMTNLTSVPLSNTVTWIGANAFEGCTSLTTIGIPNGVTSIGKNAFKGCSGLTAVDLPNSVKTLGEGAFSGCTKVASLKLGTGLTSIGQYTFENCTGLTSLTVPDTVTEIKASAFKNCSGLTSVTMPGELTLYNAFDGCTKVQTVKLTKGKNGKVVGSTHSVWKKTAVDVAVTLDAGITTIDSCAFQYATKLRTLTVPVSVTRVWNYAFDGATNLKDVYYQGTKAQRNAMQIDGNNDPLTKATWHYNGQNPEPVGGVTITTQPKNVTVKSGSKAKFTIKVKEKGVSYQWLAKSCGSADWAILAGQTKNTLTVAASGANNGTQYRCRVRAASGAEVYSNAATLTVTLQPPVIKTQPKNVTVKSFAKGKIAVKVTGKNLSYRWYSRPNANADWTLMAGETKATLNIVGSMDKNGWEFSCEIQNPDGVVRSAAAKLTVTPQPPVMKTHPKNVKAKVGGKATFKIKATGKNLSYQWFYRASENGEWVLIQGATAASYTVIASEANFGNQYYCMAYNADGAVNSNPATLLRK